MKLVIRSFFIVFLICLLNGNSLFAIYKYEGDSKAITIFFNRDDRKGKKAVVKGKIVSLSTSEELTEDDLTGSAHIKTKATVRLFERDNVYPTSILYVIDPNNIVVSKFEVKYLFNSIGMGDMLVGYGNFKLSNPGYRVIQLNDFPDRNDSAILKSRGDYFARTGDLGQAIDYYKKAIASDPTDPAGHLGLGLIYYKDSVFNFAAAELLKAHKYIDRLYDNEDRFVLLKTLAEIRFIEAYESYNTQENKIKFRKEGIAYCKEALRVNQSSVDINFLLGEFYYRDFKDNTTDEDLAKEYYQRVIEYQPLHSKANLRLAQIAVKNNHKKIALFYAKKAVDGDPSNQEALELLKRLQ